MPRARSLAWSELKVGVIVITAIVITTISIFMLTGSRGFFWQRYGLKTRFTNVAGLNPGSPVRVAGYEVGSVTAIDFVGESVDVSMELNESIRPRITTASVATLGSVSLLGESAVDITPTGGTPIPDRGYVPSECGWSRRRRRRNRDDRHEQIGAREGRAGGREPSASS
jgi:phospholipid/cholesterol/gamma-HCH transport system substrate-binding protein